MQHKNLLFIFFGHLAWTNFYLELLFERLQLRWDILIRREWPCIYTLGIARQDEILHTSCSKAWSNQLLLWTSTFRRYSAVLTAHKLSHFHAETAAFTNFVKTPHWESLQWASAFNKEKKVERWRNLSFLQPRMYSRSSSLISPWWQNFFNPKCSEQVRLTRYPRQLIVKSIQIDRVPQSLP